jgi:GntR family histidine utilization transcriptional repressor
MIECPDNASPVRQEESIAGMAPAASGTARMKAVPAYEQIKRYVLKRIAEEVWKPGELISSEAELSKQFGVARMTVARALRELTADRVLRRVQGAGTFVAPRKYESTLVELRNIADEIRGRGHRYEARVLSLTASDSPLAREALQASAAPIYHSRIVHLEEGVPIQYEDRYVNPRIFPAYLEQDFTKETPNHYMMRVSPVEHAEYRIFAQQPDAAVRRLLQMDIGDPCLLLWRRTWVSDDIATFVTLWHPASRFQFHGKF